MWGDSAPCVVLAIAVATCAAASAVIPAELLVQARTRGAARTIVELRVPAGANEAAVEETKRRVLAQIAGTPHQVRRELPGLPMLVLEASEATLQALARSPEVLRVSGESIDRPQR